MKKKFLIITSIISIIIVVIGLVLIINNNKKIEDKKMSVILADYDYFKTSIKNYSDSRVSLYDNVIGKYYLQDLSSNYNTMISEMSKFELVVENVKSSSINLKKYCINTEYSNDDVNQKCEAFVINYEQVMNYFVKDIHNFNNIIIEYNNWIKEEDIKDGNVKELSLFTPKVQYDYVDLNGDDIYSGKN